MQHLFNRFSLYISRLKIEYIYYMILIMMIGCILIFATIALFRPVTPQQQQQVSVLAQQANYPKTQAMAIALLEQSSIRKRAYLKLLHGYQFEQAEIRYFPALKHEES